MSPSFFPPRKPRRSAPDGTRARSRWGAIGEQWWSRQFVEALEWITESKRLSRGRSYARSGQVMELQLGPGLVTALVQGSRVRPYSVRLELDQFTPDEWARVEEALAGQALFLASLLAGEMPEDIGDAFEAAGVSLFPRRMFELRAECSCPDAAVPCKHAAAALYILAERFDLDPFEILAWRGRSKDELIGNLRDLRAAEAQEADGGGAEDGAGAAVATDAALSTGWPDFWRMTVDPTALHLSPRPGVMPDAILRQYGPVGDVEVGGRAVEEALRELYTAVTRAAEGMAAEG